MRSLRLVLVPRPELRPKKPTRARRTSVRDTFLALILVVVGCMVLAGAFGGLGRILDYYAHNPPPIEYTLGLPPFENPDTPPPLARHFDPPLPKSPPRFPDALESPASTYPGADWPTKVLVVAMLAGFVGALWLLEYALDRKDRMPSH
ncbi:MAG TPA: hypothetical protein PKJ98_18505 [Verrucomicrobiota bacterium]|nr:hypothetical protein [Verrucomicrobiota bacterium]